MRDAATVDKPRINAGQAFVLALVLSAAALLEIKNLSSLGDPEIWRHLRVGSWILANGKWPQVGLFSQSGNLPWVDFNWGYDVLTAIVFRFLGLLAIPVLEVAFRAMLAILTFLLAGGLRNFWAAVALSLIAQYVLLSLGPNAVFCSVLLFGIELIVIEVFRRTGDRRLLYALPILFLLWANFDNGFVYGIGIYFLFVLAVMVEQSESYRRWAGWASAQSPMLLRTAVLAGVASLIATLINPYGFRIYSSFVASQSDQININLQNYASMRFHRPEDYALLLLSLGAFLALGLRRSRDVFPILLLCGCAVFSFRAQRSGWLVAMAAVMVIGESISTPGKAEAQREKSLRNRQLVAAVAASAMICLIALFARGSVGRAAMMAQVANHYPVQAADFIRQHDLPKPLFNPYPWGSFLVWYLPEYPVAIDARRGLYPEDEELNYYKAMKAEVPYDDFAPMRQARTFLLEKGSVMGEAFRGIRGFQVAHEDNIAIVFVRQSTP